MLTVSAPQTRVVWPQVKRTVKYLKQKWMIRQNFRSRKHKFWSKIFRRFELWLPPLHPQWLHQADWKDRCQGIVAFLIAKNAQKNTKKSQNQLRWLDQLRWSWDGARLSALLPQVQFETVIFFFRWWLWLWVCGFSEYNIKDLQKIISNQSCWNGCTPLWPSVIASRSWKIYWI